MSDIIKIISNDLNVSHDFVEDALRLSSTRFKKIRIRKSSGGYRTVVRPSAELCLILFWINSEILSLLPIGGIASGFFSGSSILKNAESHKRSLYSVRIDIKNFFGSINSNDLLRVIERSVGLSPIFSCGGLADLISSACFDDSDSLPMGYPTSPSISNIVMIDIDENIYSDLSKNREIYGNFRLTRYADDFVFSTDKKGACKDFYRYMCGILSDHKSPDLEINVKKTRFMSRKGGSTIVTGLRITNDGNVRVHSKYRDHVRLLLKLYSENRLNDSEKIRLSGHLSHLEHCDPKLFTRLSFKYYKEISSLRGNDL